MLSIAKTFVKETNGTMAVTEHPVP